MAEGEPLGSTKVCARCMDPFWHRDPSDRRPDASRLRVSVCPGCVAIVRNLVARQRVPLAEQLARASSEGKVREAQPYRRGGFAGIGTRPLDD